MLSYKRINSDNDIIAYQKAYTRISGHDVPCEFLKRSYLIGFYSGEELVGGYAFHDGEQLRTLSILPNTTQLKSNTPGKMKAKLKVKFQNQENDNENEKEATSDSAEICCMWTKKSHRNLLNTLTSLTHIFAKCTRAPQKTLVCATSCMHMYQRNYAFFSRRVVYSGPIQVEGKQAPFGLIFELHKKSLLLRMPAFLVWRALFDLKFGHIHRASRPRHLRRDPTERTRLVREEGESER